MREIAIKVGDPAPAFTLANQYGKELSLSDFKGRRVLVSFHPLAFTPVCEIQMKALELKRAVLEDLNTVALGLSVDSTPAKKAWAEHMGVEQTDLLADFWPHGEVARKFDLFIEDKGISGRANFVVDASGNIAWLKVYQLREIPDIEEVIRFLQG